MSSISLTGKQHTSVLLILLQHENKLKDLQALYLRQGIDISLDEELSELRELIEYFQTGYVYEKLPALGI